MSSIVTDNFKHLLLKYHTIKPNINSSKYTAFRHLYRDDPIAFIHDCLTFPSGQKPARYQLKIASALAEHERVTARGPRGFGKTTVASWLNLWWALVSDHDYDWKAPSLAGSWRQLESFLWPEINFWASKLNWAKIGREPFSAFKELLQLKLSLATGKSFAMTSDRPDMLEGVHASRLLFTFDEAKAINREVFDAVEGGFSTTGVIRVIMISTPGAPAGYFYDAHTKAPGFENWKVIHVTCDEAIKAGRISSDWVESRRKAWGQDSAAFKNQVLGEFATADEDGLIPLEWILLAQKRWKELNKRGLFKNLNSTRIGVDVARTGKDSTVRAFIYENWVLRLEKTQNEDTAQTAGRLLKDLENGSPIAIIDINGPGAGVFDRLREQNKLVYPFGGAERTDETDLSGQNKFLNKRSMIYWKLRELLDPSNHTDIALPPSDMLQQDLTVLTWKHTSSGNIQIEPKEIIKKKLKRSPDEGDAVAMAFYPIDPKIIEFF